MVRKKKQKQEWMTFTENGERYMQCKHCQSEYVKVDSDVVAVTCSHCVIKRTLALMPMDKYFAKTHKKTGRPAGWHWMSEFVDKDGTVYHKGKEQPELKGTLKPTKVKPPKKRKKLTADQKLFKKAADWKKRLKAKRGKK
tara:strand:+ start:541 stop:960 length:420 start_codon:yes stop_codon:yes gene_type:complete